MSLLIAAVGIGLSLGWLGLYLGTFWTTDAHLDARQRNDGWRLR